MLALIPARGGSKGIPRKNIRPFAGFPLLAWSIAAGRQAKLVDRVVVSTDDEEIAAVAREWGAETPFLRPPEHAQDRSTDLPVFEHALHWLAEHEGYRPEAVVQLRPTSPIRPPGNVDEALRLLLHHPEADSVRSVVPAGQNPHKMWRIREGSGRLQPLLQVEGLAEPFNAPRQILPPIYWQSGHIDAIRSSTILQKHSMSGREIYPLLLDAGYAVDLDSLQDWAKAEWLAAYAGLDFVTPGQPRRIMPHPVGLLVMDFDGVLTDNRVWTSSTGQELVASNRSDSYGLMLLRNAGVPALVISKEVNPVVAERCKKIGVPCCQGVDDKAGLLARLLAERGVDPRQTIYLGNDVNDLPCFPLAGWAVAVADAHPDVLRQADHVLAHRGGHGAVREVCDMILKRTATS